MSEQQKLLKQLVNAREKLVDFYIEAYRAIDAAIDWVQNASVNTTEGTEDPSDSFQLGIREEYRNKLGRATKLYDVNQILIGACNDIDLTNSCRNKIQQWADERRAEIKADHSENSIAEPDTEDKQDAAGGAVPTDSDTMSQ